MIMDYKLYFNEHNATRTRNKISINDPIFNVFDNINIGIAMRDSFIHVMTILRNAHTRIAISSIHQYMTCDTLSSNRY